MTIASRIRHEKPPSTPREKGQAILAGLVFFYSVAMLYLVWETHENQDRASARGMVIEQLVGNDQKLSNEIKELLVSGRTQAAINAQAALNNTNDLKQLAAGIEDQLAALTVKIEGPNVSVTCTPNPTTFAVSCTQTNAKKHK